MHAGLRAACRIAALLAVLGGALLLHGAWRLAGRRSLWPPRFLGWAARACGCDWRVAGMPLAEPALLVANHLSWLDILALGGASGGAFVAKAEIARWPIVGWLAGLNATIYVARAERGAVRDQAASLRAALARRRPAVLFAEGTTGDGATLLPFRASLFAAVSPPPPGVRIQPVALDYGAEATTVAWRPGTGAGGEALRVLGLAGRRRLTLRFLPPLAFAPDADRKAIAIAAHDAIAAALGAGRKAGL